MSRTPEVGDLAPDFTLGSTAGTVTLSAHLKQGGQASTLLVFYPGDETPVCTNQLCDYRNNLDVFRDLEVSLLAINPQSLESHEAFAKKHGLPFPLLSDPDKSVCRAYGALGLLGMAKRALVLVGPDQRIRWRRSDLPIFRRSAEELRDVIGELSQ